jgi:hypothetical protein
MGDVVDVGAGDISVVALVETGAANVNPKRYKNFMET